MIQRLVTNGCSYVNHYANGGGHHDLANQLGIKFVNDISKAGNSNQAIIRTTLTDCLAETQPTLYVVGISFDARIEIPVCYNDNQQDQWITVTGLDFNNEPITVDKHTIMDYIDSRQKIYGTALFDQVYWLFMRFAMLIDSVKQNGHCIVVFNTAESKVQDCFQRHGEDRFGIFKKYSAEIIDNLKWLSIPWQITQGAAYVNSDEHLPPDCRHIAPGEHRYLNNFLFDHINKHRSEFGL